MTSLSFSNCTEELSFSLFFYTQFENSNDVIPCNIYEQIMPSYLLSVKYMPYHFYSSSWSGISVLFYDKSTLPFCHIIKQIILPATQNQQDVAYKWPVSYNLLRLTRPRLAWANNLYSHVSFVVVTVMTVDNKNHLSTHHLLPTTVVQLFLQRL